MARYGEGTSSAAPSVPFAIQFPFSPCFTPCLRGSVVAPSAGKRLLGSWIHSSFAAQHFPCSRKFCAFFRTCPLHSRRTTAHYAHSGTASGSFGDRPIEDHAG